jgi:hypothetical protein
VVDGVGDFVRVEFGNDIEGRHDSIRTAGT